MSLPLSSLVSLLEGLAPLRFAASWDNVGLLIDPREPGEELEVGRVLLTIDTTRAVLAAAEELGAECLIAYHPPLFNAERRFTRRRQPVLFEAARRNMAVYSPHTALDAAPGGINDWLAAGLGAGSVSPLTPFQELLPTEELKLVVFAPESALDVLRAELAAAGAGMIGAYSQCSFSTKGEGTFFGDESTAPVVGEAGRLERADEARLEMVCGRRQAPALVAAIRRVHPYEEPAFELYPLEPKPELQAGQGRLVRLNAPESLEALVARLKAHLGVPTLRLASADRHARGAAIERVAVAAGAGGSLFAGDLGAELIVTGEMRHHDVLAHLAAGRSVLLSEHTHTERGYLPRLRERLLAVTAGAVEVEIAAVDREPLLTV